MKNIILLHPIYESNARKTIIITKDDTYGWFEATYKFEWYWDENDEEIPKEEFKPMEEALKKCEFEKFEKLFRALDFSTKIGYNIEVQ